MALKLSVQSPRWGGFSIAFDAPRVSVGRGSACDLRVPLPEVSARHFVLDRRGDGWTLTDVGSSNGTVVDGVVAIPHEPVAVFDGTLVQVLDLAFALSEVPDEEVATLEESWSLSRRLASAVGGETTLPHLMAADGTEVPLSPGSNVVDLDEETCCRIEASRETFRIFAERGVVQAGDRIVGAAGMALTSGTAVEGRGGSWTFVDPLEGFLRTLDDPEFGVGARAGRPDATWGAWERAAVAVAVLGAAAGAAAAVLAMLG